jgi:hypothetical protein
MRADGEQGTGALYMTTASAKVFRFCIENGVCVRCKCRDAVKGENLCTKCAAYILTMRDSSVAKFLTLQHNKGRKQ